MMKKCLIALAALLFATILSACASAARTNVLVYMSGSDLESESASGTADLNEMVAAGIDPDAEVTVLVETGGAQYWHTQGVYARANQIHRVTQEGVSTLKTLPAASMGSGETLAAFLAFARENNPAERTLLVV